MSDCAQDKIASAAWERRILSCSAVVLCALLGMWGCLAIYSTRIAALREWDFLGRQIVFLAAGLPVLVIAWRIPFKYYRKYGLLLGMLALGSLVAVLFFGRKVNGMAGWFEPFSWLQVQPSELAKPLYLLMLLLIWKKLSRHGEWPAVMGVACCALAFAIPVALEPDYGSAGIFLTVTAIFLVCAGFSWKKLVAALGLVAALAAPVVWMRHAVIVERVMAVFGVDPHGAGWHVQQFQLAIARGGWTGSKLGNTVWTENYLPLAHNDSIFAAMAETLGFLGTLPLLVMLALLVLVLVRLATQCRDDGSRVLVATSAFMLALQALLHISVNATLLPPTGLSLPLISYGGSSLLGTMILVGMALSAADGENPE